MGEKMVKLNFYQSMMILSRLEELDNISEDISNNRIAFEVSSYIIDRTIELFSYDNNLGFDVVSELKEYLIPVVDYIYLSEKINFQPLKHEELCKSIIRSNIEKDALNFNNEFEKLSNNLKKRKIL